MGRKAASYYASQAGKRLRGRRRCKGLWRDNSANTADRDSPNTGYADVNKGLVNNNDNVNIVNITDNAPSTPHTDNITPESMSTPNKLPSEPVTKRKFRTLGNRSAEKLGTLVPY